MSNTFIYYELYRKVPSISKLDVILIFCLIDGIIYIVQIENMQFVLRIRLTIFFFNPWIEMVLI